MKKPMCTDLLAELKNETLLFHGAGSANIGALQLLSHEAGVPLSKLFVTNSKGVIWKSNDGKEGSYRNNEQKEFACTGQPPYNSTDLSACVRALRPTILVGAVGVVPNCFTKDVVDAMLEVNGSQRPIIFALSNPKSQS